MHRRRAQDMAAYGAHALHGVAGEMRPDHRVAHELVDAAVHHAAGGAVDVHPVSVTLWMMSVEKFITSPALARVHLAVVLPGDAHARTSAAPR